MNNSIRIFYWDKIKKKNIYKQAALKKFDGDEQKAREYLENWKKEQLERVNKELNIDKNIEEIKEDIEEIKEEIVNIQEPQQPETPTEPEPEQEPPTDKKEYEYTPFKLQMDDMKYTGTSTVIFGASKSGKTYLMKKILKQHYKKPDTIVIMMAENAHAAIYRDLDKKIIKCDRFYPELIKALHKINRKTSNKYNFVVVLDDIVTDKANPQLLKMFLSYRNSRISTIMLLQSLSLLSKNSRFNGNNFIFKKCNSQQYIDDVMALFLNGYGCFANKKHHEQTQLFRDITQNYGFIYLDALNDSISYHK